MTKTFGMVAKTLYGLEDILAKELIELGANEVEIGRRVVSFEGDKALMYRANLCCRTALRILKPIREFKAQNADEVYEQIKRISWEEYLSPKVSFAIDAVVNSETFTHSKFVAYKVKDAIVDYFTDRGEERPPVRVNNPDLQLHLHISHNDCTIALDSSGESLHKRGYRVDQTEAPLNEVLAAGMILKTGWEGDCDFIDPMCGSGTLLIEAAMIARNIAPGVYRQGYAFEKWPDFDAGLFEDIYNDDSREREFTHRIIGSDISSQAIDIARENIKSAGFTKDIDLSAQPLQQYTERGEKGIVVTNPPYGERIVSRDLFGLYQAIGERMKHAFTGHTVWILSYREECFEHIGLRHEERIKLKNGALDCEFRKYEIFAGKRKEVLREKRENKGTSGASDKPERRERAQQESSGGPREKFERPRKSFDRSRGESDRPRRESDRPRRDTDRPRREGSGYSRDAERAPGKRFDRERPDRERFRKEDRPFNKDERPLRKREDRPERSSDRPAKTSPTNTALPNRHKAIEELKRKLKDE